jgi:hypothetical protein
LVLPKNEQLALPFGPVWNSELFSNYWLEKRLPLEPDWLEDLSGVEHIAENLIEIWQDQAPRVEKYGKEATLEEKFIQPVLRALGWKYFYQPSVQGREPDYALFLDQAELDRALEFGHRSPDFWSSASVVADAKAWHIPLDRPHRVDNRKEYQRQKPVRRPKLGPWQGAIDAILQDDKQRPRKQRHTAKRIFERLRAEHAYTGGYTIVKDYVRSSKIVGQEMFIPLTHAPGEAQADFGEGLVVIAGVEQKAHFMAFDLPHSDDCFVCAFPAETTEAFLEGHVRAFEYFGGVPTRILYDYVPGNIIVVMCRRPFCGRRREQPHPCWRSAF